MTVAKDAERVAVVTGAGRGIGRCIAERLAGEGYAVVFADIDGEGAARAAAAMNRPEKTAACTVDVADEPQVQRMIAQTLERFGRLDLLVNNAAIAHAHVGPVEELSLADWNRQIGANLTGVFLCSKHAIPQLRKSSGAIVNVASTRFMQSEPGTEAYSASKGGVVSLTHALAVSLGPQIRVNCISPGWINTGEESELREEDHRQHPVGRVGRPEDIAGMVVYLASPAAGFVTGQNFIVDGGMTRKMIYVE